MRVQALDNFTSKLSLIGSLSLRQQLSQLVTQIEASSSIDGLLSGWQFNEGVYSFQIDNYTLYCSIINGDLYFVDLIQPSVVFSGTNRKNPRINSSINPRINSRINPNINSRINPRINSRINPNINSRINPRIYSGLNPHINSRINPKINSRLNPNVNSRINPRINSRINPRINSNMDCFYVYDVNSMQCLFYCVLVPDASDVLMIYDYQQIRVVFFGVRRETGFSVFNFENNTYVGFMESNGADGYNWFDTGLNWIRFVV